MITLDVDNDISSPILALRSPKLSTTFIKCPAGVGVELGIKLPIMVLNVKNIGKYFSFEVQVRDDKQVIRRFRVSTFQTESRVQPDICTLPLRLDEGWNQVQFDLSDFVRRTYQTCYIETISVQIHANCYLRRVYFAEKLYAEDQLPLEFRLYSSIKPTPPSSPSPPPPPPE
ncbi:Cilia- and flagella-associated protein 20 [Basidiobolus ranarum]